MSPTPGTVGADLAVLGGGAWGRALAALARRAGRSPVLWARRPEAATVEGVRVTGEMAAARAPIALLAVPAAAAAEVAAAWAAAGGSGTLVSCAKGF